MTIYRRAKSPYWHYDFQVEGRRYYGSTKAEAKWKAQAMEAALRQEATMGRLGCN